MSGTRSEPGRLDALAARLDCVAKGPAAIESQLFFRVARPLFVIARWRAALDTKAVTELVTLLRAPAPSRDWPRVVTLLPPALDELEANVVAVERVTIVRKQVPIAHTMWLRRVVGVLGLAASAVDLALEGELDDPLVRAATGMDPSAILPPLVPLRNGGKPRAEEEEIADSRLVDLELAAIDHLMTAARAETAVLGRKRRLLFAARQRLLEASAALPLARAGVKDRTAWLAREITRIDRLEAAGLSPEVSLVHQARQALGRRDPARLFAALSAVDANALAAGDREITARTGPALLRRASPRATVTGGTSLDRSARELLGGSVDAVTRAVDRARAEAIAQRDLGGATAATRKAAEDLLGYLPDGSATAITNAAVAADGFFEVGGALSPVRIVEEQRIARLVKHPTKDLVLTAAEDVHDLRDALVGDPRTILLDLAIGRLFTRRFVREEVERRTRIEMRGEVRVYVLDGSGSMKGPRARVRDAIMVAELSTLIARLSAKRDTRCTLLYRYFNEDLGPVQRVETVAQATTAVGDVVGTQRAGGTDIQLALLASLAQIAEARASDPELAQAQVVLVTDGAAAVDEAAIVLARDALKGLPIGVSVIALGEENAALRGLVSRQRAKGEPAFYHYLDDDELHGITAGLHQGEAVHAPESWKDLADDPRALEEELGGLLEDLESIDRQRDHEALERIEDEAQARRDVGLEENEGIGDGERARTEALRKDKVALTARFARWFPQPVALPTPTDGAPLPNRIGPTDDVEAVTCALASVAEVVALLGGSPLARQADAIDLLERLLPDARLTPARYRAVLRDHAHDVGPALRALHDAARSVSAAPAAG